MANPQPQNPQSQKPQAPVGAPEAGKKDPKDKVLGQTKKPGALEKEAVGKTGCGPDGSYSVDKRPK